MYVDEAKIEDLWNLDVLGIQDPIQKSTKEQHQENVLKGFRHSTIINEQGRYEVCLPWKENHPTLPMNRATAERRLESTIKKLKQDGLYQAYDDVFQDWLNDGIIEELSSNEAKDYGHYLPHRHVVKENSTTRIRPVFDASSRERGGPSLNQCLETGPNFIELIPELLLRFRLHKFGVIADIRKAFLQISVSKQDRDVMKFLWKRRPEDTEFVVYRHCRVVFGVSSSPFLLGATIDLHLENIARDLPKEEINLIRDLAKSFYVDNSITSHPTVDEVKGFKEKATLYMSKGGFDLRGWEYSGNMNPSTETPVLGLVWDKGEDILKISGHCLQPRIPEVVTKRKILAATQKVFDPIGIVCPVLLCPKLILQALWTKKTNWDETVDEETGAAFVKWLRDLKLLREVRIPRWAFGGTNDFLSLHLFVDASQAAYAAVIFVRVVCSQGIKVHLVQAKSRLAPLGKPTIPRLELMGAVIGARLLCSTIKYLNRPEVKVYCWTDSSTVLAWIKRESQWATFVWRRVQEIRQLTEPDDWRHVPGDLNPADLPSRGCSARELIKTKWWLGPQWLSRPEEEWPLFDAKIDEDAVRSEMKKGTVRSKVVQISSVLVANATGHESRASGEMVIPDTSYEGILRRLAWIMRFVANCRLEASKRVRSYLRVKEVTAAELKLIRMVQRESFFGFKDSRMKLMNTYLDEDGIIRLKSPVANRDDTMDFRHPILLDSRHSLVNKLIEYTHLRLNHAPASIMINALREKFWILGCRRGVNAVIHSCVSCRRFNAKRVETLSPALPGKRVRDAAVFEITGMDYAGPLFLRDKTKAWVCLFTCAIYRAVHFELVSSLTTENFLEAFRRFVSRRGRPSYVYTDNGTNFVGANNLLQSIDWRKVERYGVVERIQWQFNPPSAAWWGGWWERMVRSMKDMLRKVLGRAALNFEEVTTVLCDCEAVINSRPLTYLAEDTCQLVPLSPSLFFHELKNDRLPDVDIAITTQKITARLRYIQELREALRKRFRIEYLGQLKQCPSMRSTTSTLKVGDVVLIGNDLQKRLDWPLARIIELIPGIDGETRVVRLKTATGELIRPVQRVFPLEVHSGEESSDELRACHQSKKKSSEKAETVPANETCEMRKDADVEKPETRTRYGRLVKPPCRFKL
ncbi:uncharacterized protein [Temnothorax longispinosus]|uniref:uncharacterized protein n=1 Tax=Temnothorax longispinosus TaxID=300112 RepID=UPI003A99E38A